MTGPSAPDAGAQAGARLVGVGVGPGDPELLTLKAARLIRAADIVFAPTRRPGGRSLALAIVADQIDIDRQEIVTVPFPSRANGSTWEPVAREIVGRLRPGCLAVFLTEGDPLLYGSFGDVVEAVRRQAPHLAVEAVPGVSSVTAAAAAAGVALADRQERLAIVPATGDPDAIDAALREFEGVVLLKVGPVIRETLRTLDRLSLLDSTTYVRRCGQPGQQIVANVRSLLADPPADYFALMIVRRPTCRADRNRE